MKDWNRVQELFAETADLDPQERARFLDLHCRDDAELRQEVESLLACDTGGAALLDAVEDAARLLMNSRAVAGERLDRWRILSEIGHGGMGTVYLATRDDDTFDKRVAIKVVKPGMDTADVLERFRHERQILANLDHPYIARLIDGGSSPEGRPFLVMEHVQGVPITTYCGQHVPDLRARCRLFLLVCEAVSFAHRNLVVHRDLKPSNILVTEEGRPKLLDFGIAKLLQGESASDGAVTQAGRRHLTPEYASPEQVRGLPASTACDVYSLGAILYELLTGTRAHRLHSKTPAELEQAICNTQVARPSVMVPPRQRRLRKQLEGDLDNIVLMAMRKEPGRRYLSVDQFADDIRRCLDGRPVLARKDSPAYRLSKFVRRNRLLLSAGALILASLLAGMFFTAIEWRRAEMQRRRAERERSVAEERTREAEAAQKVAVAEHASEEQQRNRALIERAHAEAEARIARKERDRAEQRLTQMVGLANRALFDVHGDIERLPGATDARRKLVKTTLDFLDRLSRDAGDDERFRFSLATAYLRLGDLQGYPFTPNLGNTAGAASNYRAGLALVGAPGATTAKLETALLWLDLTQRLATVTSQQGNVAKAVSLLESALPAAVEVGRRWPGNLDAAVREGVFYETIAEALIEADYRRALTYSEKELAHFAGLEKRFPQNPEILRETANAHAQIGRALHKRGDLHGALEHYRICTRVRERLIQISPNDITYKRELLLAYGHVAAVLGLPNLDNLGRQEEARMYYERCVRIAEEIQAADPQDRTAQYDLASALLRLGNVRTSAGNLADSLKLLRRSASLLERLVNADPAIRFKVALSMAHQYSGDMLLDLKGYQDATAEYRSSKAAADLILAQAPADRSGFVLSLHAQRGLARALALAGDGAGSVVQAEEAVERAKMRLRKDPERALAVTTVSLAFITLSQVHRILAERPGARPDDVQSDWREARIAAEEALAEAERQLAASSEHKELLSQRADEAKALLKICQEHIH